MSQELFERLRRLGLTRGARDLKPVSEGARAAARRESSTRRSPTVPLEQQFPGGRLRANSLGECFFLQKVYPLTHVHGDSPLAPLFLRKGDVAATYGGDGRLSNLHFRDFVFLDTETTGLHGAGTLAFLVGIAYHDRTGNSEALIVQQYFLRDHDDEGAMLLLLDELLAEKSAIVSFNGRSFDVPLLQNRYLLNRLSGVLPRLPHLDLLPGARRLWRRRLGSVSLANLEQEILGLKRAEADVPGWLIPSIYNDYLRSKDASELARVFYHNEIDLLSMVTLADRQLRLIGREGDELHPTDLCSLGYWQADLDLQAEAEQTLLDATRLELPLDTYHKALERLAMMFKRQRRYHEALPLWEQWAVTSYHSVSPHIELAKYFEWQKNDLAAAEKWTQQALDLLEHWPRASADLVRPELAHRLTRLQRKSKLPD